MPEAAGMIRQNFAFSLDVVVPVFRAFMPARHRKASVSRLGRYYPAGRIFGSSEMA